MSDVYESRLDEMASKIAILEEEIAGLKKKVRRQARKEAGGEAGKAAGAGAAKKKRKNKEPAAD